MKLNFKKFSRFLNSKIKTNNTKIIKFELEMFYSKFSKFNLLWYTKTKMTIINYNKKNLIRTSKHNSYLSKHSLESTVPINFKE